MKWVYVYKINPAKLINMHVFPVPMIIVYVTCRNQKEAEKIAKALLSKHLIACANIIQSKSLYRWKGKLHNNSEAILFLKTRKSVFSKARDAIKKLHSYDVPCILRLDAEPNKEYFKWLCREVKLN